MNIAVVGDKQYFIAYCIDGNITLYDGGTIGKKDGDMFFCCNTLSAVLGREFEKAVYIYSAKEKVAEQVERNVAFTLYKKYGEV